MDIQFKCLFVHRNWTALAPEESLIQHYRLSAVGECAWNGNGFGPHDPGREREATNKRPDGFDAQYPIRQDWPCAWIGAGRYPAADLLKSLKGGLPYLLRYQTQAKNSRKPHRDFENAEIVVPADNLPARELLIRVAQSLPGWQATAFLSHMILYKESHAYKHGETIWPI